MISMVDQWNVPRCPTVIQVVVPRPSRDIKSAVLASATWCALFAGLHLFWALGGATGLASSAGHDLAEQRPTGFVVFGLYGVAIVLIAAIALLAVTAGWGGSPTWSRRATAALGLVGVLLLPRGMALEVLLGLDVDGLRATVGPLETRWSLALWNPWFALGGVLFLRATLRARRATTRLTDDKTLKEE